MKKTDLSIIRSGYFSDPFVRSTIVFFILGAIGLLFIGKGDVVIWFGQQRSYMVHYIFSHWTRLAEEEVYIGLSLLIALFYTIRRGLAIPLLGISSMLVGFILKKLFHHPRPREFFAEDLILKTQPIDGFHIVGGWTSFPSGHTIGAFALFGFIALSLKHRVLSSLCFVLALGVGFSRIYLINHFLQDVLFGSVLGLTLAVILHYSMERNWLFARPAWMWRSIRSLRFGAMEAEKEE